MHVPVTRESKRRLRAEFVDAGLKTTRSRQMLRDGRGVTKEDPAGVAQITGRSGGAGDRGSASFCSIRSSSADGDTGFTR